MRNPMFVYDEHMTERILATAGSGWRWTRCRSTTAARRRPSGACSPAALEGLMSSVGNDPDEVLDRLRRRAGPRGHLRATARASSRSSRPRRPRRRCCSTWWSRARRCRAPRGWRRRGRWRPRTRRCGVLADLAGLPRGRGRVLRVGRLRRQPLGARGGPRHRRPPVGRPAVRRPDRRQRGGPLVGRQRPARHRASSRCVVRRPMTTG